jgi:general secretion pathway protein D
MLLRNDRLIDHLRPILSRAAGLLILTLLAGGCAVATATKTAQVAEQNSDYDRAVVEYTKALRLDPNNRDAKLGLDRAKLRASNDHFQRGRRSAATGKYDQALVEYELAAELNPSNGDVDEQLRLTRNQLRSKIAVSREGKTELETLVERTRDMPPLGSDLPPDVKMPGSLVFRDASSRDVFLAIARFANVSIAFDPTFRETPVTVDLRNSTLDSALSQVADATRTFFQVTGRPASVLVIPDTPAKRREYEEEVVKVFYLSNADLKETMDLLRVVLDARRISPVTGTNALSVKDTPERIAAASRVLAAIDKARPEVVIDVELLEVDRTHLLEYGLQIASPGSPGINGSVNVAADANNTLTLQKLKNLTQSDILLANLPGLYYRLLKQDGSTRTLANPQLRTIEGTPALARFGEKVPVPVTTFAPIATGGTPQQPITSYNYQDVGVNIDITPRTHHNDDVTLALKVVVQAISGTGFGNLPTFANREINTVIRLKDGETNMLAGLIRDDERKSMSGIPGLSDIPVVGKIFSYSHTETQQSDIILTLTPHIVRVLDLNESDLRAFRVGRDSLAPISDLQLPVDVPRPAPDIASPPTPAPDTAPAPVPPSIPSGTTIPPPTPRLPGE